MFQLYLTIVVFKKNRFHVEIALVKFCIYCFEMDQKCVKVRPVDEKAWRNP